MKRRRLPVRRGLLATLTTIACLAVLGIVILSPLALTSLEHLDRNWSELSNIGQTYGVISALISSLALGGVIVSLLYQARDGRTAREQSMRAVQQQLIRMEMDDPTLMNATGAPWNLAIPAVSSSIREYLYIHMWVSFWVGQYAIGEMSTQAVKTTARNELFSSQAGRSYWAAVGQRMLNTSTGRYYHFTRLLDEEYHKLANDNVPIASPVKISHDPVEAASSHTMNLRYPALVCAALITGILAGWRLNRADRKAL
jgi:hypothetical protein